MGGQNRPFCKRNRFHQPLEQASGKDGGTWNSGSCRISVCRKWTFYKTMECTGGTVHHDDILLCPEFSPQNASMLTLVMGLAVAQAVADLGV